MRFLIDNALSPLISERLNSAGYHAIHVRDINMADATDEEIFNKAITEQLVIISADTDFGTLLSFRSDKSPSVILFRGEAIRRPEQQAAMLLGMMDKLKEHLVSGSVVVITKDRVRVRQLPIKG